ncbi:MAG: acetylornithine deacetylase [Gammaproteobacteria bacterium]|nr:acetylornithine deacetylase [Gammaproteobacteria bacterium]
MTTATPFDLIEKLVGFPTVSRDSNLELIHFVQQYLDDYGVESRLVHNADKTKANLYATVGPQEAGGVVLSGHTDVVPVDGQPWDTDPFTVVERDGRLYGRGTSDMKSFSAVGLALVPEMLKAKIKRPIHFALSYDEEIGCVGAPDMIEKMSAELPPIQAVIVGEPTSMDVVNAHKGNAVLETIVTGHEAHSSQTHRGVSAVMTAARLITFIDDMAREAAAAQNSPGFEPPHTTLHVGVVNGGTATNIISRQCQFRWDIRMIPEDKAEPYIERFNAFAAELLPAMQAIAPEANIESHVHHAIPGLRPEQAGAAEALVRALSGQNSTGVVSYCTEGGQFQDAGMSTVICGPGSIDQAHQPNEFIERSQVDECVAFMHRLIAYQAK